MVAHGASKPKLYDGKITLLQLTELSIYSVICSLGHIPPFSFRKENCGLVDAYEPHGFEQHLVLSESTSLLCSADSRITGSELRIGIVHARWNAKTIDALVSGVKKSLKEAGVKDENIVLQTVPGSYELPFAVQRCANLSSPQFCMVGEQQLITGFRTGCTLPLKSNPLSRLLAADSLPLRPISSPQPPSLI